MNNPKFVESVSFENVYETNDYENIIKLIWYRVLHIG